MLILVVVTIRVATDGALFDYAKQAADETDIEIEKEQALARGDVVDQVLNGNPPGGDEDTGAVNQDGETFSPIYKSTQDYLENGLNVEIEPGGPQVSSINMVASGNAEFGLAHADQLVMARNEGIELVAVAAAMQGSPQALMFHKGNGIKDFEELNGRKVYIQPGITYWEYLKSEYDLSGAEELAYTGQHVNFIGDKKAATQAFVTSENALIPIETTPKGITNEPEV